MLLFLFLCFVGPMFDGSVSVLTSASGRDNCGGMALTLPLSSLCIVMYTVMY